MATKIYIKHALNIVKQNEHYKLIDVFLTLAKMCTQTSENKFCIYTENASIYNLSKAIINTSPYITSRTTVTSCIKSLIQMDILVYDYNGKCWYINEMENMLSEGYMDLREVFFTKSFYDLNITEKKIVFYATYIMSTKGYRRINQIIINIGNKTSEWLKIFKTKNIYYLKEKVKSVIGQFFIDKSQTNRELEIKRTKYGKKKRLQQIKFKFYLKPKKILTDKLSKQSVSQELDRYRENDPEFYNFLVDLREQQNILVKNRFTDKILALLIRLTKALTEQARLDITYRIITKLHDFNKVVAPERYIATVIQAYVEEV